MGLRSRDCYACDSLIIKTVHLTWNSSSIYERDERKFCKEKKRTHNWDAATKCSMCSFQCQLCAIQEEKKDTVTKPLIRVKDSKTVSKLKY